ncbi:polysaccharide biosynthesis tyrosine autokinase [Geodermatophilus sp. SYSU D00710]
MQFREVWAALRGAWWLPLIGLLIGATAALAFSLTQTRLYETSTQLFVSTTDSATAYEALQGSQFLQERVSSYAQLVQGEELSARVVDDLDLESTPEEVSSQLTASVVPDTVLISVAVTDPSPERARDIARAIGVHFPRLVAELETPEGLPSSPVKVTVVDRPELPDVASSPMVSRDVVIGGLAGFLLGALVAVARARLDRTIRQAEEAAELAEAPVIGAVLRDESLEQRHTIDRGVGTRTAEDYRQLRTNLQFLNVDAPPTVIMVTSAMPSEGKTTAVVNLGLALADAGRKVTIVEADLRRPKVTRYLGMVGGVGLTNILAGSADLDDVLQLYGDKRLSVLASGPTPPNPGELLASSHMLALIDKLRAENDFVLVDSPPILPVADSTGLAVMMDGVLISVRYGSTRKEQLQQASAALRQVGAKTLGVILNIVPAKAEEATAYGYGRNYGYEARHLEA